MHSITGRPERMPRMMVSIAVGQLLHEPVGAPPAAELHEAVDEEHPGEEAGREPDVERQPRQPGPRPRRRRRRPPSEIITKVATDQPSPARRKFARSRVVSSSGTKRASASVRVTRRFFSCFWRSSISRASSRSSRPDMRLRPTRARRLRCLCLHPQDHGEDEQAEPDRDRDRDDEDRADDDQVDRHPIASSSRVPSPKYSARGMKFGRRCVHSKRPARLPSAFSPS